MTTQNTNPPAIEASYVINPAKGEIKVIVAKAKKEEKKKAVNPVPGFAKNIRYSINNNGGGYTGL